MIEGSDIIPAEEHVLDNRPDHVVPCPAKNDRRQVQDGANFCPSRSEALQFVVASLV